MHALLCYPPNVQIQACNSGKTADFVETCELFDIEELLVQARVTCFFLNLALKIIKMYGALCPWLFASHPSRHACTQIFDDDDVVLLVREGQHIGMCTSG